ncbi:MAG: hypothetical protein ACP5IC_02395 [Minisyncoccia bacterium]
MIPAFIIKLFFLIPFFIVGILSAYTDIRYGKIKNSYLKIAFYYICFLYLFLILYSKFFLQIDNSQYFVRLILNGVLSFIIGFLLWHFNIWAAGDAKLFTIFVLLLPLEFYQRSYFVYFPAIIILIDTVFLLIIFLLFKLFNQFIFIFFNAGKQFFKAPFNTFSFYYNKIIGESKNIKWAKLIQKITTSSFLIIDLLLISKFIIYKIGKNFPQIQAKSLIIYLILLIFYIILFKITQKHTNFKKIIVIIGGLFVIYLFTSRQLYLLISLIKTTIIITFIFDIIIRFIDWYLENIDIKIININDLKEGMFLTQASIQKINQLIHKNEKNNYNIILSSDGLTEEQIVFLKKKLSQNFEVVAYTTFPFAPFLFISTLLMILTKGSLFLLCINYIKNIFK